MRIQYHLHVADQFVQNEDCGAQREPCVEEDISATLVNKVYNHLLHDDRFP
jgi:hypothetical protein